METKPRILVAGAGTMGNGIAHTFAVSGYPVLLFDVSAQALERGMDTIRRNTARQVEKAVITEQQRADALARITTATALDDATCHLAVEAVTENPALKLEIFRQLDERTPASAILASNTSSISITRIATATRRPEKVIGMHFMNPVPLMKLVEVIRGYSTSKETVAEVMAIADSLGKTPVEVNDYPGFAANRILMPMINEAIIALQEGVAGVFEIDTVMKLGMAHPMGPLQLADFIGLDVCLSILRVMHEGLGNPKYAPAPLLVNMVTAGQTGIKAGCGFYEYKPGSKELVVARRFSGS